MRQQSDTDRSFEESSSVESHRMRLFPPAANCDTTFETLPTRELVEDKVYIRGGPHKLLLPRVTLNSRPPERKHIIAYACADLV